MKNKLFLLALIFASCSSKKQQQQKVVIGYNKKAIGYIYCDSVTKTDSVYYIHKDSLTIKLSNYDN
jgi:hypothetical protein